MPGATCARAKKVVAAVQNATEGAATLKRTRAGERVDSFSQNDMTRVSRTTVSVPAAGPKSRAEANTKVSDTENLAEREGTFMVKEPVNKVSAANVSHSKPGGAEMVSLRDFAIIAKPDRMTAARYADLSQLVCFFCDIRELESQVAYRPTRPK